MTMTSPVQSITPEFAEMPPLRSLVAEDDADNMRRSSPARGQSPLRILVAEDDADSAETLTVLLQIYGHEVEIARSGPVAVAVARDHPFDVVLLDIGLPGMDGYEVAKRLHDVAVIRRPLIIAITGYGRDGDRRQSEESGIDLHLVKPVSPALLQGVLRRFARLIQE